MTNIDAIKILTLPQDCEPDFYDELADQKTVADGSRSQRSRLSADLLLMRKVNDRPDRSTRRTRYYATLDLKRQKRCWNGRGCGESGVVHDQPRYS
jgi:hypothetical protein